MSGAVATFFPWGGGGGRLRKLSQRLHNSYCPQPSCDILSTKTRWIKLHICNDPLSLADIRSQQCTDVYTGRPNGRRHLSKRCFTQQVSAYFLKRFTE